MKRIILSVFVLIFSISSISNAQDNQITKIKQFAANSTSAFNSSLISFFKEAAFSEKLSLIEGLAQRSDTDYSAIMDFLFFTDDGTEVHAQNYLRQHFLRSVILNHNTKSPSVIIQDNREVVQAIIIHFSDFKSSLLRRMLMKTAMHVGKNQLTKVLIEEGRILSDMNSIKAKNVDPSTRSELQLLFSLSQDINHPELKEIKAVLFSKLKDIEAAQSLRQSGFFKF